MALKDELERLTEEKEFRDQAQISIADLIRLWHEETGEPREDIAKILTWFSPQSAFGGIWSADDGLRLEYFDSLTSRMIMAFAYIDRSNNAGWTDHGKGLAQKLVSLINANEHYLSDRDATLDRDALNQAVRGREYVAYPDPITVVNCLSDHEAVEYIATHYKISRESLVSNCERKKFRF